MVKFQNYICIFLIFALTSCSENINEKKVVNYDSYIDVTSTNPKAIEFYRKAKLHIIDQEYIEAKESYLSALRLDPNMFMSLLEINESNGALSAIYKKKSV